MFEACACGVFFKYCMFYVFIDVDCFVVNVDECLLCIFGWFFGSWTWICFF